MKATVVPTQPPGITPNIHTMRARVKHIKARARQPRGQRVGREINFSYFICTRCVRLQRGPRI